MMNIKTNFTNVSILFKMHNTLQEKYNTLQEKYDTLQEKYNTLQEQYLNTKKDVMEIQNNDIIKDDLEPLICNNDIINDVISNIINDIINKFDDFEFIESKKPNVDVSSCISNKCHSNTIWSKFTKKFLYG